MKDNREQYDPKITDMCLVNMEMTPANEYTCITCQCHKKHIADLEAQLAAAAYLIGECDAVLKEHYAESVLIRIKCKAFIAKAKGTNNEKQ